MNQTSFLMSGKFQGKFRTSSTRLQNWDNGNNGAYFITICTKNRKHHFEDIIAEKSAITQPDRQTRQGHYQRKKSHDA